MPAPLIAVSLKMYFDHLTTLEWARAVRRHDAIGPVIGSGEVELVILPGLASLDAVARTFEGTAVRLGAQDLAWADSGAFTGDVSGASIRQVGGAFVEIGHAERFIHHGEDLHRVGDKLAAALRSGLQPLVCVGEHERTSPETAAEICIGQWTAMLARLPDRGGSSFAASPPVIAYEPVWAIGAAEPASPDHVASVVHRIESTGELPPGTRIIYGGSAGPELVPQLSGAIDGFFLGRRAHDPEVLWDVIAAAIGMPGRTR
ncbi:triose-phosphate isomerase family protein [Microbacterium sp. NPDC097977]|uniref:triose-phosphate isomerase family protein n=1 Tax=Microbacterium sp. NPDC097977 TaxID=3155686 RepID=UPI003318D843